MLKEQAYHQPSIPPIRMLGSAAFVVLPTNRTRLTNDDDPPVAGPSNVKAAFLGLSSTSSSEYDEENDNSPVPPSRIPSMSGGDVDNEENEEEDDARINADLNSHLSSDAGDNSDFLGGGGGRVIDGDS